MRTIRTLFGCCIALAAALQTGEIFADDVEGIARVSHCDDGCTAGAYCDGGCGIEGCDQFACCGAGACYGNGCGCNACGYGRDGLFRRQMRTMSYGWNGEADWCPHCGQCAHNCKGDCQHGFSCKKGCLARKLNCMFGIQGGSSHAPGHGYVMPVKRPMWDVSYPYNHMLNATAVGQANGQQSSSSYGNVYMPTDTTQLGYSYGHVPYWMPRPGMVPGVPNPDMYHLRVCLPDRCSGNCRGTCPACQNGHHAHGHVISNGDSGLHEVATEPTLAPVPQ